MLENVPVVSATVVRAPPLPTVNRVLARVERREEENGAVVAQPDIV